MALTVSPVFIIIAVIIVAIVIIAVVIYDKRESICVNGRCYDVYKQFDDHKEAAAMLDRLNMANIKLMRHLKDTYGYNIISKGGYDAKTTDLSEREQRVMNLLKRYNPEVLRENSPFVPDETSYTLNKGEQIYFCLRSKMRENNPLHIFNVMQFVNLHELSHVAAHNYGHETEFWLTFKWILQEAERAGVYTPMNYEINPVEYCGMNVDYNPYFDPYYGAI